MEFVILEERETGILIKESGEEKKLGLMECLREALIIDLYSRENCKSRPAWAQDAGSFKHMTHHYCKNGKLSHVEPFHYDFIEMQEGYLAKQGTPKTLPERNITPVWALFSYEKRNPLTHCADIETVEYVIPERNTR